MQTFNGDFVNFELPKELTAEIKQLCQDEGVTLFMLLLAAFQSLLHRYSNQDLVNIGTPIANRNRADIEGLIGFFINTLVMRGDFSGNPTFREFLQQTREAALGAYAHQDLPFEMIVDALQPDRDMSRSPLFQAMFVIQNTLVQQAQHLPDLEIRPVEAHSGAAKFDLTLFMLEEEGQLQGAWEYNTDLFDAATIKRMIEHFAMLLESIVSDPGLPVAKLTLLTLEERRTLLVDWNDTAVPFPHDRCLHELFAEQVNRSPEAVAVRFKDEMLTYKQLNHRANQLAHHLRHLGQNP